MANGRSALTGLHFRSAVSGDPFSSSLTRVPRSTGRMKQGAAFSTVNFSL